MLVSRSKCGSHGDMVLTAPAVDLLFEVMYILGCLPYDWPCKDVKLGLPGCHWPLLTDGFVPALPTCLSKVWSIL